MVTVKSSPWMLRGLTHSRLCRRHERAFARTRRGTGRTQRAILWEFRASGTNRVLRRKFLKRHFPAGTCPKPECLRPSILLTPPPAP